MKKEIIEQNNFVQTKEKLIKDFFAYIDVSKKSQKTYLNGINAFYEYISINNIENPTREDILGFREHIKKHLSVSTVNTYMISVRNFFKWLEYSGIYKNITENVKGVKIGETHRKEPLTKEQCQEMLNNVKNSRERVIFLLATTCGLRANELVNIRLEDFKLKQGKVCLYVLGKDRDFKEDFVIIDTQVYKYIQEYIQEYNITDYLFVSSSNNNNKGQLTTKTIRLIVKSMLKRIGIDSDEYSLHSLRHTFATLSLKNGQDIRSVQQALRHKSLSTSMIYIHDLEKLENGCSNSVSNLILS